jgi:RNA polymerase sigma-70 factor, ECF subfamily
MTTSAQAILPVDDDHTLGLARAGDAAAFADIVRRHQSMVFSLALHALRNRTAAEDLAQEVFLELYRSLRRIESPAHVVAWLRRVTSHRCIDELRRRRRQTELPIDTVPELSDGEAFPRCRELFLEGRLHQLIAGLPPRARMVIVLRYQEELEPSEIAEILHMPLNTVKSHVRRSIAVLRAGLVKQE